MVKGQSFTIELGDWLHKLYPHTQNLFLYRHAETWLQSGLRAYGRGVEATDEERRAKEKQRREILGPLVPLIAQYDPNQPLPHAGTLSLMWLRAMERYVEYCNMGVEMLAIRYDSWRSDPRITAEAMLDYCRCRPTDMTDIYATLTEIRRQTLICPGKLSDSTKELLPILSSMSYTGIFKIMVSYMKRISKCQTP